MRTEARVVAVMAPPIICAEKGTDCRVFKGNAAVAATTLTAIAAPLEIAAAATEYKRLTPRSRRRRSGCSDPNHRKQIDRGKLRCCAYHSDHGGHGQQLHDRPNDDDYGLARRTKPAD